MTIYDRSLTAKMANGRHFRSPERYNELECGCTSLLGTPSNTENQN